MGLELIAFFYQFAAKLLGGAKQSSGGGSTYKTITEKQFPLGRARYYVWHRSWGRAGNKIETT